MREIKFRGKRIDTGDWVYGFLFKTPLTSENFGADHFGNSVERWCISDKDGVAYEIEPKTLGEYTGLKDKNGKEIYEGDYLRWEADNEFRIKNYTRFEVFYNEDKGYFSLCRCHHKGSICGGAVPPFESAKNMILDGTIHDSEDNNGR